MAARGSGQGSVGTSLAVRDAEAVEAQLATLTTEDQVAIKAMVKSIVVAGPDQQATPDAILQGAAMLAHAMGLRLELGHVMAWKGRKNIAERHQPEQWEDTYSYFVSAEGWAAWGAQFEDPVHGQLYGGITFETMTRQEKIELLIEEPGEPYVPKLARRCLVSRKDWVKPAEGIGIADPVHPHGQRTNRETGKTYGGNPIEVTDPRLMADARASRQAFKRAFPMNDKALKSAGARSRRMLEAGETLQLTDVGDEMRHAGETMPEPERQPTDEWTEFWKLVGTETALQGMPAAAIHDLVEQRTGVNLVIREGGTKSFVGSGLTPVQAAMVLGISDGRALDWFRIEHVEARQRAIAWNEEFRAKSGMGEAPGSSSDPAPSNEAAEAEAPPVDAEFKADDPETEAAETAETADAPATSPDTPDEEQHPAFLFQQRIEAAKGEQGKNGLGAIETEIETAYGKAEISQQQRGQLRRMLLHRREANGE